MTSAGRSSEFGRPDGVPTMGRRQLTDTMAAAGVVVVAGVSCGSPTEERSDVGADDAPEAVEAVLAEIDSARGAARTERLVELAQESAGGTVSLYTSLTADLVNQIQQGFQDDYGLTLEVYRAANEPITRRLLEEVRAGAPRADVVETNGADLVLYGREDALAVYEPPARADLVEDALVDERWTGTRLQVMAPAWNEDLVQAPPTSWTDFAEDSWRGRLGMEPGNADWYMALCHYWMEEEGRSAGEVQELWRGIADGTLMVTGHSSLRELLVGGEFEAAVTLHSYMTEEAAAAGAPLAWQPTVSPAILRTQGAGVVEGAPNPAGAILLMDWLLAEDGAQRIFVGADIHSVREDLWSLSDVDVYPIDVDRYLADSRRWDEEFEQIVRLGEAGEGS